MVVGGLLFIDAALQTEVRQEQQAELAEDLIVDVWLWGAVNAKSGLAVLLHTSEFSTEVFAEVASFPGQ